MKFDREREKEKKERKREKLLGKVHIVNVLKLSVPGLFFCSRLHNFNSLDDTVLELLERECLFQN